MSHIAVITTISTLVFLIVSGSTWGKNVLFLVSDDMRPQIGAYQGADFPSTVHPNMYTPNLDKLAGRSLLLKRAYVQQAVCNPSRASTLTGRRPDSTHVYDLTHYWRKVGGNYTTIPQYFKQHGYATVGMGKIFHPGMKASGKDDPMSWTEPYFHAANYWNKYDVTWMAVNDSQLKEHKLPDQEIADHAVETLQKLAPRARSSTQPFFLAVGFHRPHLPFVVPEEFFQHYPLDKIHLPDNMYAPVGMPEIAWSNFDELRTYTDIKDMYGYGGINTTLPASVVLNLRRAYYAAISYTDSLIGRVLDELDRQGLRNDTVVSFWGDHGWQLGEHGEWCKHTNFELTTHAPMMLRAPGLTDSGVTTEQLTEFVDLFPSIVEAAGLPPLPLCPTNSTAVETCREGTSFMSLVKNPAKPWKSAVFSQYPRMAVDGNVIMGYTMRTDKYRYTEWVDFSGGPDYLPDWHNTFHKNSIELYDHGVDPGENVNRAFDSQYKSLCETLSKQLHRGWREALPL